MRSRCVMRYYLPFPEVIPHTRAGCSRVTHPSATDPPRRASPFDLNVLCTPPAFILSQDQTLKQIVYLLLQQSDSSSELFILAFFTFLELCSLWFWQILYSHLLFCFVLLSSVVQLSSFNRSPFFSWACLLYHFLFPLSIPFLKVFWKIFKVILKWLVGQQGLEPRTDRLWAGSSNQLSYWPVYKTVLFYDSL